MEVFESALVCLFVVSVTISKKCKVNHVLKWDEFQLDMSFCCRRDRDEPVAVI